jgi:hypothetical protein
MSAAITDRSNSQVIPNTSTYHNHEIRRTRIAVIFSTVIPLLIGAALITLGSVKFTESTSVPIITFGSCLVIASGLVFYLGYPIFKPGVGRDS